MNARPNSKMEARKKSLVGFAAARSGEVFVIHIIDDAAEVFEIEASRENLELIAANLQALIVESAPAATPLPSPGDEAST
jgi:hypothetical protein